ncbi:hypothetical protein GE09DRAFT_762298 [Coniochaeta sp. 2T2.1]|nr:hypothetical protein GE09DRAFT_762298 [Coniochaeta sp. 2T2.1]
MRSLRPARLPYPPPTRSSGSDVWSCHRLTASRDNVNKHEDGMGQTRHNGNGSAIKHVSNGPQRKAANRSPAQSSLKARSARSVVARRHRTCSPAPTGVFFIAYLAVVLLSLPFTSSRRRCTESTCRPTPYFSSSLLPFVLILNFIAWLDKKRLNRSGQGADGAAKANQSARF